MSSLRNGTGHRAYRRKQAALKRRTARDNLPCGHGSPDGWGCGEPIDTTLPARHPMSFRPTTPRRSATAVTSCVRTSSRCTCAATPERTTAQPSRSGTPADGHTRMGATTPHRTTPHRHARAHRAHPASRRPHRDRARHGRPRLDATARHELRQRVTPGYPSSPASPPTCGTARLRAPTTGARVRCRAPRRR